MYPCEDYDDYKTGNSGMMRQLMGEMKSKWNELDTKILEETIHNMLKEFVKNISVLKAPEY